MTSFLLQSVVVLVSVLLAGQISRRLGQPAVLGQLLVGVLLGPALLGWLQPTPFVTEIAEIGVVLLMFMAGLETNFEEMKKTALAATLVAVGGVALPFVGGWLVANAWGYESSAAIFTGVLLVATSVSISAQTLRELGYLKEKSGVTILSAAVLDDVLGIVVLSLVLGAVGGGGAATGGGHGHGGESIPILLLKIAGFFAAGALVGWKVLPRVVKWVSRFEAGTAVLATGISLAMVYAWAAEQAGLAGIIGAYLAGLMLSLTDFKGRLLHEVEHTAFAFFVPFFFVSVGLTAKFAGMTAAFALFVSVLVVVAVVTKLVGAGLGAFLGGFKLRESVGIGAGMVARGEVGLIVAAIGLEQGLIQQDMYTAMVLVSLLTTLVTPPLLKLTFKRKTVDQAA
jgi:Kef-type K+ transport system membrane component KefB